MERQGKGEDEKPILGYAGVDSMFALGDGTECGNE